MFISPDPPKDLSDEQKLQFETLNTSDFSFDFLIKQSNINAVNSATQVLTITYTAIETTSKEYRELLSKLIALMNEAMLHNVSDSHWDEVLEIRSQMQLKKKLLMQYVSYMDYVHKMAEATSEVSFLSGMDNLSTSLSQRIDDAIGKVQVEKMNNAKLEEEYVKVQEESIKYAKTKDGKENKDMQGIKLLKMKSIVDQ